jgi:hypothetical protein
VYVKTIRPAPLEAWYSGYSTVLAGCGAVVVEGGCVVLVDAGAVVLVDAGAVVAGLDEDGVFAAGLVVAGVVDRGVVDTGLGVVVFVEVVFVEVDFVTAGGGATGDGVAGVGTTADGAAGWTGCTASVIVPEICPVGAPEPAISSPCTTSAGGSEASGGTDVSATTAGSPNSVASATGCGAGAVSRGAVATGGSVTGAAFEPPPDTTLSTNRFSRTPVTTTVPPRMSAREWMKRCRMVVGVGVVTPATRHRSSSRLGHYKHLTELSP